MAAPLAASRTRSPSSPAPRAASARKSPLTFAREGAKVVIADLNQDGGRRDRARASTRAASAPSASPWTSPTRSRSRPASPRRSRPSARIDILVSNAGIQIVAPLVEFEFADWKKLLAIHLDGAFLTTRAALRHMYRQNERQRHLHGLGPFQGGLAAQGALCHRQARPDRPRQGAWPRKARSTASAPTSICPGFVRTPLVDKQIPEQAQGARHLRGGGVKTSC